MKGWSAWVRLFDQREVGTSIALFRILIGLVSLYTLIGVIQADLIEVIWVDKSEGGYRSLEGNWLVQALGGASIDVMWRLTIGGIAASVMMALGIGGRVLCFLTLQLFMATTSVNGSAGSSYDELITNPMWLLVLAPSTQTLSIDCKLRTGAWRDATPVPAWTRYLAIYQLFLMYWTTGLQKVSAYWTPGGEFSALYYILLQPNWQRWDNHWVAWVYPLTQLGTAMTWLWEIGAPVLLVAFYYRYTADRPGALRAWFNRVDVRMYYAAIGASFHLLVTVLMDIGPFSWASLAFYVCLVHPDEWGRMVSRRLISPRPATSGG